MVYRWAYGGYPALRSRVPFVYVSPTKEELEMGGPAAAHKTHMELLKYIADESYDPSAPSIG